MAATPFNPALWRKAPEDQRREQLITLIVQQAERISQLTEQAGRLNEHVAKLTEQIDQLGRTSPRPAAPFRQACTHLEQQADRLPLPSRADPVEEKIANRLRKQRDHLFTFLHTRRRRPPITGPRDSYARR